MPGNGVKKERRFFLRKGYKVAVGFEIRSMDFGFMGFFNQDRVNYRLLILDGDNILVIAF